MIHHLDRSKDVTKAIRALRKHGVPVSFPMQIVNGETIFAIGKDFTVTADQILELLDRGELHAEGVRRFSPSAGGGYAYTQPPNAIWLKTNSDLI